MSTDSFENQRYVGAMFRVVWQWVRDQIYVGVVDAGYDDLNPAHVALFRHPSLDGLRPTELAMQLQITKQSVNDLVGHLEACGYVIRTADPADGRARVVRLTTRGRQLERTINAHARRAEQRIADTLGPRTFAQLRRALEQLSTSLVAQADRVPEDATT
jgi:DNA-binding MarR family transcriptional regulator